MRLLWLSLRLGVLHELEYRANFLVQLLTSAIGAATLLALLAAIQRHADTLAGWRPAELLALWGVFHVLTGLIGAVVQPSFQRLIEEVGDGRLDFVLTKPADAQLLASLRRVEVWRLADVVLGLLLLGAGLAQLGGRVGVGEAAAFVVALAAGAAVAYSCCLALAAVAFWSPRMENALLLFLSLWETGRWPVAIYPGWLRGLVTFLLPVALATTLPAEALTGRATATSLLAAVVLAAALLLASRRLWQAGLRRYAGASA
jgi:ABC-2 type transport system permease protein